MNWSISSKTFIAYALPIYTAVTLNTTHPPDNKIVIYTPGSFYLTRMHAF